MIYWAPLTKEELEMIIYYLEQVNLPNEERTKLIEKLKYIRDHEK